MSTSRQCHRCQLLVSVADPKSTVSCPRCFAKLPEKTLYRVEATWALLIAALILYIPANTLPIMSFTVFGFEQPDTIISGALFFLEQGQWPIALLIFMASIVVPILKFVVLTFLLISIKRRSSWRSKDRMMIYQLTEFVGRWSMVDVFVVAIMAGLVQFGNMARIDTLPGTFAFAGVVILTMLAAISFDEQLIWQQPEKATTTANKDTLAQ